MNKTIYIFILLAIVNLTCHKENWGGPKCKDSNTVKIPQHALDFFYFKVGSWWVYKCVQTGERDRVWVREDALVSDKYKANKQECNCGWGECYQTAHTYFKSTKSENAGKILFFDYLFAFSRIVVKENERLFEIRESFRLTSNSFPGYKMQYDGNNNYTPASGLKAEISNLKSLVILGKTHNDILKYSFPGNPNPPDWVYEAYYAKNIHLIKYRLHSDSTEWELEKFKIVK